MLRSCTLVGSPTTRPAMEKVTEDLVYQSLVLESPGKRVDSPFRDPICRLTTIQAVIVKQVCDPSRHLTPPITLPPFLASATNLRTMLRVTGSTLRGRSFSM